LLTEEKRSGVSHLFRVHQQVQVYERTEAEITIDGSSSNGPFERDNRDVVLVEKVKQVEQFMSEEQVVSGVIPKPIPKLLLYGGWSSVRCHLT